MVRFVLFGSAVAFGGIGLAFLVAPGAMGARVGVSLAGATADNDVRAVYGGLQLGCAAFLALCATRPAWYAPGIAAQLLTFGGLAGARLLSWLAVGLPEPLGLALHGAEAAGLVLGGLAWRSLPGEVAMSQPRREVR